MTESKSPAAKEVWITGIGIVSSLGEGLDAHWDALNARKINVDDKRFAPYIVHPLAPVTFDAQIPKKGDQRQMEAWQRIGTYAAGLALDSAGIKGNKEILGRTDMIVAAGGGERDLAVDLAIMTADAKGNSSPGFLNERLMNDLRPTLFPRAGIPRACRSPRRQAVCKIDQGGRRPRAAQAAGRGDAIAGSAVAEARHGRRQRQSDHGRDRRRAGDLGRKGVLAPAPRVRRAR